jgi:hypothetical protein
MEKMRDGSNRAHQGEDREEQVPKDQGTLELEGRLGSKHLFTEGNEEQVARESKDGDLPVLRTKTDPLLRGEVRLPLSIQRSQSGELLVQLLERLSSVIYVLFGSIKHGSEKKRG